MSSSMLLLGLGSVPLVPSSVAMATFLIWVTLAGSGSSTVTVTVLFTEELTGRLKGGQLTIPAEWLPPVEAFTKVTLGSKVSLRATFVAPLLPMLETGMV